MPGSGDRCAVCGNDLGYTLPRCGFCHKSVCNDCAVRVGGSVFCSRACAHNFFFGGDDDVDERGGAEE